MKNAIVAAVVAALVASGATYAATGAINGRQIRNHSIAAKKLTRGAIRHLHGRRGPRGPAGPAGATGATGARGATGATGATGPQGPAGVIDLAKLSRIDSGPATVATGTTGTATANCPSGDRVVGGGFTIIHGNNDLVDAYESVPTTSLTGWETIVDNASGSNATIEAYAVCAAP